MEERKDSRSRSPAFDFDEWAELANSDPEAFEERRRKAVEELIASAPPRLRKRLGQLQWRIDAERKRCRTPMVACMRLYDMMWDFIYADRGFMYALNLLDNVIRGKSPDVAPPGLETRVLSMDDGRREASAL